MYKMIEMRLWNRFNRERLKMHIWERMALGWRDEERWTKPCRQGGFLKRKQKNKMKKNTSYWLSFMLEGISGASVRGAGPQWSPLVSQTQRGPTVGSLLATLMMRLSCSLLPYRDFPLWSFFVSFSFCHHHGNPPSNLCEPTRLHVYIKEINPKHKLSSKKVTCNSTGGSSMAQAVTVIWKCTCCSVQ